jgi:5'-methylthioadenosine phosphorylase
VSDREARVGIIGGSGLYDLSLLKNVREVRLETPFGSPSDAYRVGDLDGTPVAFLARHGRGHRILPTELNFRANVFGFKMLGVSRILSASAVGSMKEAYRPTDIVLPNQFIDRTRHRVDTFFGDGIVAHVSLADPVCPALLSIIEGAAAAVGKTVHVGGTYICIEGPHFSTRAESLLYRSWGVDVIGMTNAQEARLAREAEICYATMALVTDYDCWHESEEAVSVEQVVGVLKANAAMASRILTESIRRLDEAPACGCGEALRFGILTAPEAIPASAKERLRPIVGKYLEA